MSSVTRPLSLLLTSLAIVLSGCENSNGIFEKQVKTPSDIILVCPDEPLVLLSTDKLPADPTIDFVVVKDQNDAELWNEAVRRAGAICRATVRANCQFYKDLNKKPQCEGTKNENN